VATALEIDECFKLSSENLIYVYEGNDVNGKIVFGKQLP
jgi:hypothetical protein